MDEAAGADLRHQSVDCESASRMRRPVQIVDDVAQLVLRERRSGRRWCWRREPADLRRQDAEGRADASLHLSAGRSHWTRSRRPARCGSDQGVSDVCGRESWIGHDAGRHLAQSEDRDARGGHARTRRTRYRGRHCDRGHGTGPRRRGSGSFYANAPCRTSA